MIAWIYDPKTKQDLRRHRILNRPEQPLILIIITIFKFCSIFPGTIPVWEKSGTIA